MPSLSFILAIYVLVDYIQTKKEQKEEIDVQITEWQNTKSLYEEKVEELICQINPPQFH